jgi:hypothetical protein
MKTFMKRIQAGLALTAVIGLLTLGVVFVEAACFASHPPALYADHLRPVHPPTVSESDCPPPPPIVAFENQSEDDLPNVTFGPDAGVQAGTVLASASGGFVTLEQTDPIDVFASQVPYNAERFTFIRFTDETADQPQRRHT